MKTTILQVEADYNVPERKLREDLLRSGHSFVAYAPPPVHRTVREGVHIVTFKFFRWDGPMEGLQVKDLILNANFRQATQIEMRALAGFLQAYSPLQDEVKNTPLQCFGTEWTHPDNPEHVMMPCFTLSVEGVEWDLPLGDGLFPGDWIHVGVESPQLVA